MGRYVAEPIDLGSETDRVYLLLYGTGFRARGALSAVSVRVGGETTLVDFAGAHCCLVGLDQVNILLPRSLAGRGEVEVTMNFDGTAANPVKVIIK